MSAAPSTSVYEISLPEETRDIVLSDNGNKRKASKTSVACAACKSRKTKCSGGPPPCPSCTRLHTKCAFDPESDMRRRDSKDHFKAYRALLDAFISSTRDGDTELSCSLYKAIQLLDTSGKLTAVAQSYAMAVDTELTPQSDSSCQPDMNTNPDPPRVYIKHHGMAKLQPDERPVIDFDELRQFWCSLGDVSNPCHVSDLPLLERPLDPMSLETSDLISKSVVQFKDYARHSIRSGASLQDVLGSSAPSLMAYFGYEGQSPAYSVWRWACQFAKTFPDIPLTLQLGIIYIFGIQMRFYVYPCETTFNDLPRILRPIRRQYITPHAAGLDFCHVPIFKHWLFSHWEEHDDLLTALLYDQECHWPYSDLACFQLGETEDGDKAISQAFLEHIRELDHYTLGPRIIAMMPQLMHGSI